MEENQKTVLLVGRDPLFAKTYKHRLESDSYCVKHAFSVKEAVKAIIDKDQSVDLVLVDIDLGEGVDDIESAELILKEFQLPVLLLSPQGNAELLLKAKKVDSYGVLVKDSGTEALDSAIKIALKLFDTERRLKGQKDIIERMGSLAKIGTWEYSLRNSKLSFSHEASKIFELTDETEPSLDEVLKFYSNESSQIIMRAINRAFEKNTSFVRDSEIKTSSGNTKWVRTQGEVIRKDYTDDKYILGTIQDISEIRLLDKITSESELTLNQIEQITHIGHWSVNLIDGSIYHSDEIKRIFGYEPSEYALSVEEAINAYHPADREEVTRLFNRAVETGENYEFDLRVVRPSGEIRQVHSKGYTEKNEDGKVTRVYGVFQDITEMKQSLELLEQSKMLLKASLESQKDTILLSIDRNYRYLFFNKAHADTMKLFYDKDVQIGMNILDCITVGEDRKAARANYDRALQGESHSNVRVYGEGTKKAWFEGFFNPIRNDKDEIIGATALARDISERKYAEEALQESHNRYHALFEQAGDGIILLDREGNLLSVNDTYAEMHGYSADEMLKIKLETMDVEGDAKIPERIRRVMAGETLSFEVEHYHRDGHIFPILVTANLITTGTEKFIIGIHRDLSVYKRMEFELQKTQRLESLGVLAGGIAHDFNNLMSGIYTAIELANEEADRKKASVYYGKALATIDRARALTLQLLTFAKGGSPVKNIGRLFPYVEETAKFALSGSNVTCNCDVQNGLWNCSFDKNQIGQVIENLVLNAQQAMPNGGAIELIARNVMVGEKENPLLQKGKYVEILIKDSGIGIPKESIVKIFDPFFSTKSKGQGLGLTTCYSIMQRHGGCINVESEAGKGSTFKVYIPSSSDSVPTVACVMKNQHKGIGVFVVMDDEEVVRDMLKDMLEKFGYSVICTDSGEKVIELFESVEQESRNIVGMIFDLTVQGGMGGQQAVKRIRKINKDIPIFVASGYADDPVMKKPNHHGFTSSILKPFRKDELSDMLNIYMGTIG